MTREQAISCLITIKMLFDNRYAHEALDMAIEALSAESKTGEWIEIENGEYLCSNCSRITIGYPPSNCPHCRAKMQGGDTK